MKKILVINGHQNSQSLCTALAERYHKGASDAGHEVRIIHLGDLEFDPILRTDRLDTEDLEPDIVFSQQAVKNADHLVFIYPTWWGTYPALLKGFMDRAFLSGFAFRHRENSKMWDKLLKGKTARLVMTMDTPKWYYQLFYKNVGVRAMRTGFLDYCGVHPVKTTIFSSVRSSTASQRVNWLDQTERLGRNSL